MLQLVDWFVVEVVVVVTVVVQLAPYIMGCGSCGIIGAG